MNKSLSFYGREKEVEQLRQLYADHRNALIVGPPGIGKTALMRHLRQTCPLLLCEETSSLRRICDGLERDLGWRHYKLNVIERKKRLIELSNRNYEMDSTFGRGLLDLDRRIHELDLAGDLTPPISH